MRPATAGQEQFLSPQLYNFETGTLVTPYAPRKARAADWSADAEPFRDDRMYNAALRTDYDVTDNLTLTSITSYSDYKRNSRAADDGTAVQDYDSVAHDGSSVERRVGKGSVRTCRIRRLPYLYKKNNERRRYD